MKHVFSYCSVLPALIAALVFMNSCGAQESGNSAEKMSRTKDPTTERKVVKTNEEWKKVLTPEQFHVARMKGTERAFTGKYWDNHEPGMYKCVCCGAELFSSDTKFDSGTGWPSFYDVADKANVEAETDMSHGMLRTEVMCNQCGAHLGHVFEDGPEPTGLRYCINSASLNFEKK